MALFSEKVQFFPRVGSSAAHFTFAGPSAGGAGRTCIDVLPCWGTPARPRGDAGMPHDAPPAMFLLKVVEIDYGGRLCNLYHSSQIGISGFPQPGIGAAMVLSAKINQNEVLRLSTMLFCLMFRNDVG